MYDVTWIHACFRNSYLGPGWGWLENVPPAEDVLGLAAVPPAAPKSGARSLSKKEIYLEIRTVLCNQEIHEMSVYFKMKKFSYKWDYRDFLEILKTGKLDNDTTAWKKTILFNQVSNKVQFWPDFEMYLVVGTNLWVKNKTLYLNGKLPESLSELL